MRKEIRWGVILSYLSQGITLLSGLLYTPIMLRILGQSEYGLYQLSSSVISYLGLLNFGFSSGYLRIYSRYKIANDTKKIESLNGMYMMIFSIISIISIICGVILINNIDLLFSDGLTEGEKIKIRYLMLIMIFSLVLSFYSSVFNCYTTAHSKFVFQSGLQVLKGLLNPFITLPLLLLGYGSIAMTLVSFGLTLINLILSAIFCIKKLKMRFNLRQFDFNVFKELSNFTVFIFLSTVVDKINLSLDNFLLGRFCGTSIVAIYGVGSQINGFYNMISSNVVTVFAPKINIVVAKDNNDDELTDIFIRVSRMLFLILSIVLLGFVFFGEKFICFWAGTSYKESYYVALILMSGCFIQLLQVCGIEIQKAKNMHKARSVAYFVIALFNIAISIPMINMWGAVGAAIGTFISYLLGGGLFMNWYYQFRIHLNMKKYWKEMLKLIPLLVPSIIVGIVYWLYFSKSTFAFFAFAISFVLVYLLSIYGNARFNNSTVVRFIEDYK